jgi:ADP-ribose pyrophosphatase YjhB (NUDIX family)
MHQWTGAFLPTSRRAFGFNGIERTIAGRDGRPDNACMNFCSTCGSARLEHRVPDGDHLPRFVCPDCGAIHYRNPKVVVGCLPEWGDQILLCRRAIEPRHGLWTLPAGFLENGETLAAGAARETLEEADARVDLLELYTVINLPQIGQIYMMFRSRLLDLDFGPGPESLEVRLFREDEIPWETIAFRTIGRTLRNYFVDRRSGAFPLRLSTLERKPPLTPDLLAAG